MKTSPVLLFHICAAIVGLIAGFAALFFRKGFALHRRAGDAFSVAMLCMAASAIYLALEKAQMINAVVGALTFYMVVTGWSTVQRKTRNLDRLNSGATFGALAIGAIALAFGLSAANSPTGLDKDGVPAAAYFVFGGFSLFGGGLDIRVSLRGGVSGAKRLARHLWRMCFALLITSISFFNGTRSKMLPEWIRLTPVHDLPTVTVVLLLLFWLLRTLFSKANRKPHPTHS